MVIGAFLAAGCATHQESGDASDAADTARTTQPAAAVARPLTTAQLTALAFQEGEVPQAREGTMAVQEPQPESTEASSPPVSDPACQTVLEVSNAKGAYSHIGQIFNWKNDIWPGTSTLASYEGAKARTSFDRLRDGLKSCRSFSGIDYVGTYRAKLIPANAPRVGDEAVRYRITTPVEDDRIRDEQYTVVRVGSVIATFTMLDVGGSSSFPSDLINKQVERLRAAQHA
nr:hypothetical protein OG999_27145 [Streptomyces sp. NBC_00886]